MRPRGDAPEVPKHRPTKDRARWCKGKVGVGHEYRWQEEKRPAAWQSRLYPEGVVLSVFKCARCGKQGYPERGNYGGHLHPGARCTHGCGKYYCGRHPRAWTYGPAF